HSPSDPRVHTDHPVANASALPVPAIHPVSAPAPHPPAPAPHPVSDPSVPAPAPHPPAPHPCPATPS
ncbi:MAG: hypothetical protein AB4911_23960, partial [Oscillochloridaceae bacterium umkhey_bin13]